MVALRTLVFSIFVPGVVAIGLPYLYMQTQERVTSPSLTSGTGIAGSLLIVLGGALYFWCASEFTFRGKGTPAPIDPPKSLMMKGPYRWTRNPMYIAVLSTILGEALVFRSLALFIYAVLLFGLFHLFITIYEEPTLHRLFGDAYSSYQHAVPRWVRLWHADHRKR